VKKFPACYGTQRFVMFTESCNCTIAWVTWFQSPICFLKIHFNTVLPFVSRSYNWNLVFTGFLIKILFTFSQSLQCVLHALPISFSLMFTLKILQIVKLIMQFSPASSYCIPHRSNILLSNLS
jgi:hypothetical protein